MTNEQKYNFLERTIKNLSLDNTKDLHFGLLAIGVIGLGYNPLINNPDLMLAGKALHDTYLDCR